MTHPFTGKPVSDYVFEEMGFVLKENLCLQVLERSAAIEYLGKGKAHLRFGCFRWKNCVAFAVMCAVGQVVRYVYTRWLNYHDDFDRRVFDALPDNDPLMVQFYAGNGRLGRIFLVEHSLGDRVEQLRGLLESLPSWSVEQHAETVSRVTLKYGAGETLWREIGDEGGPVVTV